MDFDLLYIHCVYRSQCQFSSSYYWRYVSLSIDETNTRPRLSIGTYDWGTLKRSLKAFGVTVFVSILISYIYFSISHLKEIQQELLSRTNPAILDVLIALFGGVAGIVAGSHKVKDEW